MDSREARTAAAREPVPGALNESADNTPWTRTAALSPISSIQLHRTRDRVSTCFHHRRDEDQWRTTGSPLTQTFSI